MSTSIKLTDSEFSTIADLLKNAPPEEGIHLHTTSGTTGTINGDHPMGWSADFTYANGALAIHGHGIFGGKVERGISDKLNAALSDIRAKASA